MSESERVSEDEQQRCTDMQPPATDGARGDDFAPPQKPQRVLKLTEKGQELRDEQVRRLARRFSVCYERWKDVTKEANQTLSGQCSNDLLNEHITKVNNASRMLVYEELRRISVPDHDTRRSRHVKQ